MSTATRPLVLTAAETAVLLGQSRSKVYEAVRHGVFRNVGLGRAVRIPRADVEAMFASPVDPTDDTFAVVAEGTFT